MAISGSLKDVKFIEILRIVGKKTGRLWIYNFDTNVYQEWFVHENNIRAVRVNRVGQRLSDELLRAAASLNEDTTSQYIFYAQDLTRLPMEIEFSIESVAVRLLTENLKLDNYRDMLPNPDTRFAPVVNKDTALSGELATFWNNCRLELGQDFSAVEVAGRLRLDLEQTQFNLYKLRAAGFIKPLRVASFKAALIKPPPTPEVVAKRQLPPAAIVNTERRSLVQRMLEALSLNKKTD